MWNLITTFRIWLLVGGVATLFYVEHDDPTRVALHAVINEDSDSTLISNAFRDGSVEQNVQGIAIARDPTDFGLAVAWTLCGLQDPIEVAYAFDVGRVGKGGVETEFDKERRRNEVRKIINSFCNDALHAIAIRSGLSVSEYDFDKNQFYARLPTETFVEGKINESSLIGWDLIYISPPAQSAPLPLGQPKRRPPARRSWDGVKAIATWTSSDSVVEYLVESILFRAPELGGPNRTHGGVQASYHLPIPMGPDESEAILRCIDRKEGSSYTNPILNQQVVTDRRVDVILVVEISPEYIEVEPTGKVGLSLTKTKRDNYSRTVRLVAKVQQIIFLGCDGDPIGTIGLSY